jgi:hypothetical protein
MSLSFGVTFDYLCPFARNASEHILCALDAGADWRVRFLPYSLTQCHVKEGEPAVWDRDEPNAASGILALQVGVAVRDRAPHRFAAVHRAIFAARHDHGANLKDADVLHEVVRDAGVDADAIFARVTSGEAMHVLRTEHETVVRDHNVWGVPTFIAADRAVFVRLMDRPNGDPGHARRTIERVLDLVVGVPNLHEFKETVLAR